MALKPPLSIATRLEVLRAIRELEDFESAMSEAYIKGHHIPALTPLLKDISEENGIDLHKKEVRQMVNQMLLDLRTSAPVVHVSFAVEPNEKVTRSIAQWFRTEISKNVILQIGVQPSIGIGCVVRTTNKFFDFSLRRHLVDKSKIFVQTLEGIL